MNTQLAFDLKEMLFWNQPTLRDIEKPTDLLSAILPNVYLIAGIILFLYMIFGGFLIITSGGNPKNTDQGKSTIFNAIIGFAIVFTSYWLIQIIQLITGIPILSGGI